MDYQSGKLRIIAGIWKGRNISVPDEVGLRPTGSRMRETVFNWLMPYVVGSQCLDLFAGSGILGFEALSRGASHVDFVDRNPGVIAHLKKTCQTFNPEKTSVIQGNVPQPKLVLSRQYDIVFLDPPFKKDFLLPTSEWLIRNNFLSRSALVYIECEKELNLPDLVPSWHVHRHHLSGQVNYFLFKVEKNFSP